MNECALIYSILHLLHQRFIVGLKLITKCVSKYIIYAIFIKVKGFHKSIKVIPKRSAQINVFSARIRANANLSYCSRLKDATSSSWFKLSTSVTTTANVIGIAILDANTTPYGHLKHCDKQGPITLFSIHAISL